MRSCWTRSTNLYGPAHTGFRPNLSPVASAALGDTIMPARSVSWASSGEKGALRLSLMVARIDHLDRVDLRQLGLAERALHVEMPVEAVLGGGGVEDLAVVELHARSQLDRDRLAVGRDLVTGARAAARCRPSRRSRTACRRARRRRCARCRCATATDRARRDRRPGRCAGAPCAKALPAARQKARAKATLRAVSLMMPPSHTVIPSVARDLSCGQIGAARAMPVPPIHALGT